MSEWWVSETGHFTQKQIDELNENFKDSELTPGAEFYHVSIPGKPKDYEGTEFDWIEEYLAKLVKAATERVQPEENV